MNDMQRRKTFRLTIAAHDEHSTLNVSDEVAYFDTDPQGNLIMAVYGGPECLTAVHVTFTREDLQNFIDEFTTSLVDPARPGKYRSIHPIP